jgi:hypothetical protein
MQNGACIQPWGGGAIRESAEPGYAPPNILKSATTQPTRAPVFENNSFQITEGKVGQKIVPFIITHYLQTVHICKVPTDEMI